MVLNFEDKIGEMIIFFPCSALIILVTFQTAVTFPEDQLYVELSLIIIGLIIILFLGFYSFRRQ